MLSQWSPLRSTLSQLIAVWGIGNVKSKRLEWLGGREIQTIGDLVRLATDEPQLSEALPCCGLHLTDGADSCKIGKSHRHLKRAVNVMPLWTLVHYKVEI